MGRKQAVICLLQVLGDMQHMNLGLDSNDLPTPFHRLAALKRTCDGLCGDVKKTECELG